MRSSPTVLVTVQLLSLLAAAHPFIIVSTKITEVKVQKAAPTRHILPRQGLLDSFTSAVDSVLGLGDDTSTSSAKAKSTKTTSASVKTIIPPAIASTTLTASTSSQDDDDEDESSTSTDDSSTTESSTTSTSTSTSIGTSTTSETTSSSSALSTTASPAATSTLANTQPTEPPQLGASNDDSNDVPPGGIAVAIIMSLLIVTVIAWLIFKYHPRSQAWWAAREEKKFQERSYRENLDGPNAGSPNLRQQALGGSASRRATMLKSFFAPSTAKLGDGKEIRRKPVNWGAESPSTSKVLEDNEKLSMTASAAPMGQIERFSLVPEPLAKEAEATVVSPISLKPRESLERLPPISPLSTHHKREHQSLSAIAGSEHELPPLPPVPTLPPLIHAKRGSDGVFRLN